MSNLPTKQISVCKILFGFVGLLFFLMLVSALNPLSGNRIRTAAKIAKTREDERRMSFLLEGQASEIGGLTNINNQFVLNSLFSTGKNQIWFSTNAAGEVIDIWQTPYQIKLVGQTNFNISSAGPNKKFGDADDIIFNSASNETAPQTIL